MKHCRSITLIIASIIISNSILYTSYCTTKQKTFIIFIFWWNGTCYNIFLMYIFFTKQNTPKGTMKFEQNLLFAGLLLSPIIHKHCTPTGVCYTQTRPITCSTISRSEVGQRIVLKAYLI